MGFAGRALGTHLFVCLFVCLFVWESDWIWIWMDGWLGWLVYRLSFGWLVCFVRFQFIFVPFMCCAVADWGSLTWV